MYMNAFSYLCLAGRKYLSSEIFKYIWHFAYIIVPLQRSLRITDMKSNVSFLCFSCRRRGGNDSFLPTLVFLIALLMPGRAEAQSDAMQSRMNRSRLNIGAYILQPYARTEQHVRDIAGCGIDFMTSISYDKGLLDLFSKYHIGAVVNGVVPGWWGGDGSNAGQLSQKNPLAAYEKAAASFQDHPAIWGIDIGDEPSALDFPHYGRVYEKVSQLFPRQFPYLNLYPNYASVSQNTAQQTVNQLGTATYQQHIAEYIKHVPSDYVCYDFYLYSINVHQAYENLRTVSDACLGAGRSMWIVLQVNSSDSTRWISENQLRFQAYTAMAFGAENIIWGCYTAGWWYNNVLDTKGQKTPQYDKLRRINAELHRLGPAYMKYRRVRTDFVSFQGTKWLQDVGQQGLPSLSNGTFTDLQATDRCPLVVGSMVSRSGNGDRALFVCAADDPYDEHPAVHTITFKAEGRRISVMGTEGPLPLKVGADGTYSIDLASNQGALIEAVVY